MSYKKLIDVIFGQVDEKLMEDGEVKFSEAYTFSEEVFIEDIMSTITEKEAITLYKRFAFNGYEFRTLRALGIDLGLTPERIRQIAAKAIRKLKHPSRSMAIRENMRMSEYIMQYVAKEKERKDKLLAERDKYLETIICDIEQVNLSVRAYNCIKNEGIKTLAELSMLTERQVLLIPNMGRKSLIELKQLLGSYGLCFGGSK